MNSELCYFFNIINFVLVNRMAVFAKKSDLIIDFTIKLQRMEGMKLEPVFGLDGMN